MLCARFGAERPATRPGELALGLTGGASEMTAVVRALDEIGALVEHIELTQPSLDDVFAEATGRRLEGAEAATARGRRGRATDGIDSAGPAPDRDAAG